MTINNFIKKYNLHDSLLESINYNKKDSTVTLEIDFCYWQQKNYTSIMQETGMIRLIFSNVYEFNCTPFSINSDEIINVSSNSKDRLYIEFYNDVTNECHSACIAAKQVDIFFE